MHPLLLNLPTRLETDRLILRPYQAGDGTAYFAVCQHNRDHLARYETDNPARRVTTPEEAEILMRQFALDFAARRAFFFGAWERASGEFAAQIYVGVVNWDLPEFELGYFVDCAHEGQGFVTEAARAALRFCFEDLHAHRVRLGCNDTNDRSIHVAERCGFVREAHLRQTRKAVLLPDGTFSGDYLYGLLRSEYEASGQGDE